MKSTKVLKHSFREKRTKNLQKMLLAKVKNLPKMPKLGSYPKASARVYSYPDYCKKSRRNHRRRIKWKPQQDKIEKI